MSGYTINSSSPLHDAEVLSLYDSVEWSAYSRDPELLLRALRDSSLS